MHPPANFKLGFPHSATVLRFYSFATLLGAAGLLLISIVVRVWRPTFSPYLVPTLLLALVAATWLSVCRIWSVWTEHHKCDHALESARAEAEALRKATLALSQNLAMDSVLDTLLQCIGELVPFDRASVLFVEDATHLMVAREANRRGVSRAGFIFRASENVHLRRILFECKSVFVPDTTTESDWIDTVPFDDARSWMGIPLVAAGTVIGILSLCAYRCAALTTEHLRLSKILAVSAAVAIQNVRVRERAAIYATELELRIHELQYTQKLFSTQDETFPE